VASGDNRASAATALEGRRAGVLAHPTSLPGPYGIGTAGPEALQFLDWITEAGISVWQVLPLTVAGGRHSPYSGPSAFAGNPWMISLRLLAQDGWLPDDALAPVPAWPTDRVEFGLLSRWKPGLLRRSWEAFRNDTRVSLRREWEAFVEDPLREHWLEDWALFAALKEHHHGRAWTEWDPELRRRESAAVRAAARESADAIDFQRYLQFVFDRQWRRLLAAARKRGVRLLSDLPIYVAHDSADVWTHPELFRLDAEYRPTKVAGVPPDYFSETGQLWGNPTFDWDRMKGSGYAWWVRRVRSQLAWADRLRLDHFRGFAEFWEIDAGETTAVSGRWVAGPGRDLFDALRGALGQLPFVAEDLGTITDDVHELRRELELPGMQVLQFGFEESGRVHHPRDYETDTLAYTGTHDNDTARGWFEALDEPGRRQVLRSLNATTGDVVRRMVESVYESPARLSVVPLQDLFGLDSRARMNTPAVGEGNWEWRASRASFDPGLSGRLRELAGRCARLP